MRESVSIWLFEENGEFAFPRGGIEAESQSWDDRLLQANFSFADGRVLSGAGRGRAPSPIDNEGKPSIIGAGSLQFRCVERSEEHTSELQSLMRISYAVFCLKKKKKSKKRATSSEDRKSTSKTNKKK